MSRGGFRFGAGRPRLRKKCEQMMAVDIRVLFRRGQLAPFQSFLLSWTCGGEPSGTVRAHTDEEAVTLTYSFSQFGKEFRGVRCRLALTHSTCHYGNTRPWFVCPDCGRRCAIVYGISVHGMFACRVCQRLAYSIEAECEIGRLTHKLHKLEARLMGSGKGSPKLQTRTLDRLLEQLSGAEDRWEAILGDASVSSV